MTPAPAGRPRPPRRGLQPKPSSRAGNLAAFAAGLGAGLTVALSLPVIVHGLGMPGGVAGALGILTAMVGTYLALLGCLLMARLPFIENEVGQDRLTSWHRKLGPYALVLIVLHVVLTTLSYAQGAGVNVVSELITLTFGSPWMLPAMSATLLMIGLGVISWRRIRARMKYETWLTMHQYFYLAVALAFGHQVEMGSVFIDHPVAKWFWIALYVGTAAAIVVFRILKPLLSSIRHGAKVVAVVPAEHDTVHVYIGGRNLRRLKAEGGQWFSWRFGTRNWWWQGHPYSLSAKPTDTGMRITVKDLGDQSGALATLKPGTRVMFEGPYGAFRADRRHTNRVVMIGAGVGITPIRALLEELPEHVEAIVVYRVHEEPAPIADELRAMADASGGRITVFVVAGNRREFPMNARQLRSVAPHIAASDVYLCGPTGFIESIKESAIQLGVPSERIHDELFEF
jgi:predicted ferric reductase